MSDVTHLLDAAAAGDHQAAAGLLPPVYDELRKLAAGKLAHEPAGQTLDATALVHEAYLRLVAPDTPGHWDGRAHFFAAAAEAMRRILVDRARAKGRAKGRVPEPGEDLAEGLALVESERRDVDQADRVGRARPGDRDHGPAVRVADQQHRTVDLVDEAREVLGVAGQAPVRVGRRQHRHVVCLQLLDDRRPVRGVSEASVYQHHRRRVRRRFHVRTPFRFAIADMARLPPGGG